MTRLYFDYTRQDEAAYDLEGAEFQGPRDAIEFAEAIAQDLKRSLSDAWIGWSVEVRNAEGELFHSLPIEGAVAAA